MLNHLRTLLLNRDGDAVVPDWVVGEQLVDPAYRAVVVPRWLAAVRARLFGADPDRSYLNYRLAQYTALLHATELERYVLAKDPRVTYRPPAGDPNRLFDHAAFTPTALPLGGAPALAVQGVARPVDASGRSYHEYLFTVGTTTVTVDQAQPRPASATLAYTPSGGLSAPVPLGDSGPYCLLPGVPAGTAWQVSFHVRPAVDPGSVLAGLRQLDEPTLLRLFGAAPAEPYRTFANLFHRHGELAYALGGLLLAATWRTDELRGAA